jgi:hypothetical protein
MECISRGVKGTSIIVVINIILYLSLMQENCSIGEKQGNNRNKMGRSQVLYNRTSARFRAARGNGRNNQKSGGRGRAVLSSPHSPQHQPRQPPGRYADDEDDEQQEESNDDIQYHNHHHPQQNTKLSSSADERKEQQAQHILSYDSATSTYASRIPIAQLLLTDDQNLDGDHDQQQQHPWKSFLHTTPTMTTTGLETSHPLRNTNTFITTEEWCSHMAKALETSLSRAERLRMPAYLVETIYGRTAATTTVENKKTATTPKQQQSSLLPRSAREPPASTAATTTTTTTTTTSSTTKTDTRIRLDPSPPASSSGEDTPSGVVLLNTRGSLLEGPRRRDDDDDDPPPPPASSLEDVSMDQWLDSTLQPPPPSKNSHEAKLPPKQSEEEEENLDEWLDSVIS